MKYIAAINADLSTTPLGTRSRLGEDLGGKPILRRTVERLMVSRRLSTIHVLASIEQAADVQRLLEGLPVTHETHVGTQPPYAALVRTGRWWGLDGWRGGVGGLCVFDEELHVALLTALAQREQAEAVVVAPAAAPMIDPVLIDAMIHHYETYSGTVRLTIVQAPPGLAPLIIGRSLLEELLPTNQPLGSLLTYHPDNPRPDATGKEPCYRPPAEILEARGRLIGDTRRGLDRLRSLFRDGGETWDAARIASWLMQRARTQVDAVPEEIEIELTTANPMVGQGCPSPGSPLPGGSATCYLPRPSIAEAGPRGPISLDTIRAIGESIADYDDVRIVLGGFGEPCLHPQFGEICRVLRQAGAAAIAVRTGAAFDLPDAEDALFDTPVDVIEVTLDAATPEVYQRVYGVDAFAAVMSRLDKWISRRAAGQQVRPLMVPSFVKMNENFEDLEAFFDQWQRRLGAALITGYSHCADQRPRRAVTSTTPPQRDEACRRLFARTLVLADGRVTTCDQDFTGRQALGRLGEQRLSDIWLNKSLQQARTKIAAEWPLCSACEEWHRP